MENISLDDFLSDGMIQEKDFRDKVKNVDWTKFSNKKVMRKRRGSKYDVGVFLFGL